MNETEISFDPAKYRLPSRRFYSRETLTVANALLGAFIRHETPEGILGGLIVETEGYLYTEPGCHAHNGMTERNRAMFGPPGHVYTYFTYGNHWMFNIVTEEEGCGCAVLIRALEPVEGTALMWTRRPKAKREVDLCNGPGKLAAAMGIGREQYGWDLLDSKLTVLVPSPDVRRRLLDRYGGIVTTARIGLGENKGAGLPYRYYMREHPCVSVRIKGKKKQKNTD
jgi:DNA-3-methyladenine glycosylase